MNSSNLQVVPAPPSLMKSLMAGFDAISNHIGLILFSFSLDIILWLGPRLRMAELFETALDQPTALPETSSMEVIDRLRLLVQEFSLFSVLRAFPVGVPSLMASRSPVMSPVGEPVFWEVHSLVSAFGLWLLLTILGSVVGTLYFACVAQAALKGKVIWRDAIRNWPRSSVQILLLMALWMALLFAAFTLFGCSLSFILFGAGFGGEQLSLVALLVFVGVMMWILIPLLFSPHGVFVEQNTMWMSLLKGVRLTRMTLPTTALFFLAVFVISEGLRFLWNIPPASSWWSVVGIIGHAFVTTSLLAASFVYYQDATRWMREMLRRTRTPIA
jgi:hypothetical protein